MGIMRKNTQVFFHNSFYQMQPGAMTESDFELESQCISRSNTTFEEQIVDCHSLEHETIENNVSFYDLLGAVQ
jgi:hypothetical protein